MITLASTKKKIIQVCHLVELSVRLLIFKGMWRTKLYWPTPIKLQNTEAVSVTFTITSSMQQHSLPWYRISK